MCLRRANLLAPGNSSIWMRVPSSRVRISRRPTGRLVAGRGRSLFSVFACASMQQHSASNTAIYILVYDDMLCARGFVEDNLFLGGAEIFEIFDLRVKCASSGRVSLQRGLVTRHPRLYHVLEMCLQFCFHGK